MTITLASILAANAAKAAAEQQEIDTAEKAVLLQGLAATTEGLDAYIDLFQAMIETMSATRAKITAIQDSPTVSNELLEELTDAGDDVIDRANFTIVSLAEDIVEESEAALAADPGIFFHFADGGAFTGHIGGFFGERGGEFVIPRQAAE